MESSDEYKKSLHDEIDWKIIDQLHSATLNFTSASLEIKRIFFALITGFIAIAIGMTKVIPDKKIFISAYIIIIIFWYLDSYTYFYQERLRDLIDQRLTDIFKRNESRSVKILDNFTLPDHRTSKHRIWRSIKNPSVWIYPILIILNTAAFYLLLK